MTETNAADPGEARHRHRLDAARRRRRQDLSVGRLRHDPQDRRLRARHADHRRLRDRPGLGDGAVAAGVRGAGPADVGGDGGQQRHRHHALGRRRARHRAPPSSPATRRSARRARRRRRSSPPRRSASNACRRSLACAAATSCARTAARSCSSWRSFLRALHFSDKRRTGDDHLLLRAAERAPGQAVQGRRLGRLRLGDAGRARSRWTRETGIVRLLKVTGAHDVGRVLNRLGIEGQIEGGIVMGQGYALTENLMVESGRDAQPEFPRLQAGHRARDPGDGHHLHRDHGRRRAAGRQGRRRGAGDLHRRGGRERDLQRHRRAHHALPFTPENVYRALHGALPRCGRRHGAPRHEAAHRARHGAGAVAALRDAALRCSSAGA